MSGPAIGARGQIGFAQEGVWGKKQPAPNFFIEFTSEAMLSELGSLISASMRPDRADHKRISGVESAGGDVNFVLNAGQANGGRSYVLLGGISGTTPGTPLPGGMATLPINLDAFTCIMVYGMNGPVFQDFMGSLDANGSGLATLDASIPWSPDLAGFTLSFAFALYRPWDFVSNPVNIELTL